MTLQFPQCLAPAARNRLSGTLAQAELDSLPPVDLVLEVFCAFVKELLDYADGAPTATADEIRTTAEGFLAALTRAVYWQYPQEVRLADSVHPSGLRVMHYSSRSWNNLTEFRSLVSNELREIECWVELQRAIVDLADRQAKSGAAGGVVANSPVEVRHVDPLSPRQLVDAYKRSWPRVSNASIFRAADVHSADFYRWRKGLIPPRAPLARRLEQFLRSKQAPPGAREVNRPAQFGNYFLSFLALLVAV
jgi:hypothetical protein